MNDRKRFMAVKLVLIYCLLVVVSALAFLAWLNGGLYSLTPLPKWAIASALDGKTDPTQNSRLEIVCRDFDCNEVLPKLPAVSSVKCTQNMGFLGACCTASFGETAGSEIHIWWRLPDKYEITLTPPMCRSSSTDRHAPTDEQLVRCDELWRS